MGEDTQQHDFPGDDGHALLDVAEEIFDVLREVRDLNKGVLPDTEQERVIARKRALVERLDPGFYDRQAGR